MSTCPACGAPLNPTTPEPPVGTVVKDRHGALHKRFEDGWGEPWGSTYHFGVWAAMEARRGPLEIVPDPTIQT